MRIVTHLEAEPPPAAFEPERSSTEGMQLSPGEHHARIEEEEDKGGSLEDGA